jgi:hypothetical protein
MSSQWSTTAVLDLLTSMSNEYLSGECLSQSTYDSFNSPINVDNSAENRSPASFFPHFYAKISKA